MNSRKLVSARSFVENPAVCDVMASVRIVSRDLGETAASSVLNITKVLNVTTLCQKKYNHFQIEIYMVPMTCDWGEL